MALRKSSREAGVPDADPDVRADGLDSFYRGERDAMERCYREQFAAVNAAIGQFLGGADRETAVHEVFARLIAREDVRRAFQGGSLRAWLAMVARNHAIDYRRRLSREAPLTGAAADAAGPPGSLEGAAEARQLIERFRRDLLPAAWAPVFDLCVVRQMTQREAAKALGISRTTLAYRELLIRRRLRRFIRDDEMEPQ
jgi:RNA polymerase sigma-70 factor (ECF subfamily)